MDCRTNYLPGAAGLLFEVGRDSDGTTTMWIGNHKSPRDADGLVAPNAPTISDAS